MKIVFLFFMILGLFLFSCTEGRQEVDEQPNIILIMADDMGYSDIGCYGSEIQTPNLDMLAENGVIFSQFYNAARCCPSRASLLTGLYPHQAGMGEMVSKSESEAFSPYQGYLASHSVTIPEVLKDAGYETYMSGKWHVGEFRPHWPVDRGFDQYYGLISGAMNYFNIEKAKGKNRKRKFARNDSLIVPDNDGFYATDAFTDEAIEMLKDHEVKDKPFFLYLAYNAPHWPLHAHEEAIQKYLGQYMEGWEELRMERYERMLQTGIISENNSDLPPLHPDAADWDSLSDEKKREMDRKMAVHAAMVHCMDRNIGHVLSYLKEKGKFENTVIMFLSDNGASDEYGPLGRNFREDLTGEIGTENSYHSLGLSWAIFSNLPFRKFKVYSHEGGIHTPFIFHWPKGLKDKGVINHQVAHVIDLLPTCIDLANGHYPDEYEDNQIMPMEGISLLPYLDGQKNVERTLFWEHVDNRAIRKGDWKLVSHMDSANWELYNMAEDKAELHDLVEEEREIADSLREIYDDWARNVGVNAK